MQMIETTLALFVLELCYAHTAWLSHIECLELRLLPLGRPLAKSWHLVVLELLVEFLHLLCPDNLSRLVFAQVIASKVFVRVHFVE